MRFQVKIFQKTEGLKLTKTGFFYSLLTIFIGVSAVNTGNNLLFVILSLMLSFMWLSGIFGKINLKGITFKIELPKEIYANREVLGKLHLTKKGSNLLLKIPSFLLFIKVRIEGLQKVEEQKLYCSYLFREEEIPLKIKLPLRGRYKFREIEIFSPFPLNFFIRRVVYPWEEVFYAFPEPKVCVFSSEKEGNKKEGNRMEKIKGVSLLEGVRDYQKGSPKKLIFWKGLAKWGVLTEKLLVDEEKPPLVLDIFELPGTNLEEKLSCACYLILKAYKEGTPIGMRLGKTFYAPEWGEHHKLKLLKALSLYERT